MKSIKLFLFLITLFSLSCEQNNEEVSEDELFQSYVQTNSGFPVVNTKNATSIFLDKNDYSGVLKIAEKFRTDIQRVTSVKPELITNTIPSQGNAIVVGTIGKSELIDKLVADKKLDVSSIKGKWETFLIETVKNPFEALVRKP